MAKFFIDRPIVAIVISIIMVILGLISMVQLPIALFPDIAPPEIQLQATYVGADAVTVEQSVATPIEQQMAGVDNSIYMYSTNASNGQMTLRVDFDVNTIPNDDQILTQMRYMQAESQLPTDVRNFGVTIKKSTTSPLMLFSLYSPNGAYDEIFLANYAYVNINDPLSRVEGVGQVTIFGAGQYAMRFWVQPDHLAKLGITVAEILDAIQKQNTVNPAGQIGAQPVPQGQEFTYTVRSQGRLLDEEEFGQIIVRADPDGSIIRLKDVARIELGAQTYGMIGRLNGKPSAIIAVYQLPGSNAIDTVDRAKKLMEEMKDRFPEGLDYEVSLDTTLAVREGINEIVHTLFEALVLVIIVVFIFLQGWRATLIPLLAVPVSLVGTFAVFPLLDFSINTLSLFGLVLAIGLVVDDAIVVVEAVEHHIEKGLSPKDATRKAMEEVSGPVIAIALILAAVFVPTAFIPGITGRLYQQFALTIALSVIISAFNALTLSPALSAMLLRPRTPARGPMGVFFGWFNQWFGRATDGYVGYCHHLIGKTGRAMIFLLVAAVGAGLLGAKLPTGFLPMEDQGYVYLNVQLPLAASLQRTDEVAKKIEAILQETPGIQYVTTVVGYSLLSTVQTTYNGFFFVTLAPWEERTKPEEKLQAIFKNVNQKLAALPEAVAFLFPPPAIPGVGTSGGVSFILEDRSGQDVTFLADNLSSFMEAARQRPEIASMNSTFIPSVPQVFAHVDRDKVLKQGVKLEDVYKTLQTFMGGVMVNYFNRFGRVWQVYVQAEGEFRTTAENVGQFFVRNKSDEMVPLSTLVTMEKTSGPEFTMRFNGYRSAQVFISATPGYTTGQVMQALEEVFAETMPREMGFDYIGMSFQEKVAAEGVPASVIFGFSLLFVFLILAAQYESWALPFSVLICTPIAVVGAFGALLALGMENDVFTQIGLVMLIGLSAKNAILIVEFAKMEYEKGRSLVEAALTGARLRLRPILMTSFAFILGVVPLVLSSGSGAHGRILLGVTVIGGMLAASFIAIFLIPVSFYVVERLAHRHEDPPDQDPDDPEFEDTELLEDEDSFVSPQTKHARTQFKLQGGH
ncbi:MAG: multidrug efflux RND transporter permease subunit [Nitrospirales bacterium]|nr:multidrug efflux RND transporter permease subunit [Nitrospirales bacterium]MDR4483910.1 multidrug efflux RND transporter permease subunit [Nitrospirales bacterium]